MMVGKSLKLASARRQLGTALHLWMRGLDPVAVQCLASGASEVTEHFAEKTPAGRFINVLLAEQPDLDIHRIRKLQRQFWNAFKHATGRNGDGRDDEKLLASFDEPMNEASLLVGWTDYGTATGRLPIEAQVFQVWYLAKYPEKLAPGVNLAPYHATFGSDFPTIAPDRQMRRFGRAVEKARRNKEVMGHRMTEREPLLLSWPPGPNGI